MTETMLQFRLIQPTGVLLDVPARRVVAESLEGSFAVLPRHIDGVAALAVGILQIECLDSGETDEDSEGKLRYAAVDGGLLVKCAGEVTVSTAQASVGESLEAMADVVAEQFRARDEQERLTRSALARLEAGALRELQQMERGLT